MSILKDGYRRSVGEMWFGEGIYFFESLLPLTDGQHEAREWAISARKYQKWAVLESNIVSHNYLDLVGMENKQHRLDFVKVRRRVFKKYKERNKPLEDFRDNIVFQAILEEMPDLEVIRALTNGTRPYEYDTRVVLMPQIMICVKDSRCIQSIKIIEEGEKKWKTTVPEASKGF